tara:strand:- start:38690 stop:40438 length:1749 start_codon:yes stop_codon:yes gene_type:complete
MPSQPATTRSQSPEAVTGVQLAQGIGHQPTRGFWAEAWEQVIRRPGAIFGLAWISVVGFFAVFSPVIASGHPLVLHELGPDGAVVGTTYPLLDNLKATDVLLLIGAVVGLVWMFAPFRLDRSTRLGVLMAAALQCGLIVILVSLVRSMTTGRDVSDVVRDIEQSALFVPVVTGSVALLSAAFVGFLVPFERWLPRFVTVGLTGLVAAVVVAMTWTTPIERYDYRQREALGQVRAVYTLIPLSPQQGDTTLNIKRPGSNMLEPAVERFGRSTLVRARLRELADADPTFAALPLPERLAAVPVDDELASVAASEIRSQARILRVTGDELVTEMRAEIAAGRIGTARDVVDWMHAVPVERFVLGTDSLGQDVLSQMMHACRLSISIGLVSTIIAVIIGVTVGALMGYFGGWVDLLLYRVVEIFMSIPVLFLLIIAAAVLPRNTYVMMIIIGCVSWTGAARFVRAEFLKLRNQDFVQSARAVGLPLPSILFKHMLPNGVTPVLVDSSFAIAAAILAEATLSYLGLGPANQASWGRLLSDATNQVGAFVWWLAIFPGLAIFLTVLSYNLIGEAFRDAIDPKLKKARV